MTGECECKEGFGGPGCNVPIRETTVYVYDGYMGDGHYYGGYAADCHPVCIGGCKGPSASDCNRCNDNAYQYKGYCRCKNEFYGYDCSQKFSDRISYYTGRCSPSCNGKCYGPDPSECDDCTQNAHKDYWGFCVCDENYYGYDCSQTGHPGQYYQGTCHVACDGPCYGEESYDCVKCAKNAYRDGNGYCQCFDNHYGDGCNLVYDFSAYSQPEVYSGRCSTGCASCTGPGPSDCSACVVNAHWVGVGECACDNFWRGEDCSVLQYTGPCGARCQKCTGPNEHDCTACVMHASFQGPTCECNPPYMGQNCEVLPYSGPCDPMCDGCTGPDSNNCMSCIVNAEKDKHGFCVCSPFYSGQNCENFANRCDERCVFCSGPKINECRVCVENAQVDLEGYCQCVDPWAGDDCKTFTGGCFHTCLDCTSTEACSCTSCVKNAIKDAHNCCICDKEWTGAACAVYSGPCDPICSGCNGPSVDNCLFCAFRASMNTQGGCKCDPMWSGIDCSVYQGQCDKLCDSCYGPKANECYTCMSNASLDNSSYCVCNEFWTGDLCDDFIGECHSYCADLGDSKVSCHGIAASDCSKCNKHAFRDEDGFCHCEKDWTGAQCDEYSGTCDPKCNGCRGPNNSDCLDCTENTNNSAAILDGVCKCMDGWNGTACDLWTRACFPTCQVCTGPKRMDCRICAEHAIRDIEVGNDEIDGLCYCMDDWSSKADCSVYSGPCDRRCGPSCFGPSNIDWDVCGEHAHRDYTTGACICDAYWLGPACDIWGGFCDPRCSSSCSGPANTDCIDCVTNAVHVSGMCVCSNGWDTTEDCSLYSAECSPACKRCNGVEPSDWVECVDNASRSKSGICQCNPDWKSLATCSEFEQKSCFITCLRCSGPSVYDCSEWVDHAYRDFMGRCVCAPSWGSDDCQRFTGLCHHRCAGGCTGPTDADCLKCVETAGHVDGVCECIDGWTGDSCLTWAGSCHERCHTCTGPTSSDCISCGKNAYRDQGKCVCIPGWNSNINTSNCLQPIIICDKSCLTCEGPLQNQCLSCSAGYSLIVDKGHFGFCVPCNERCKECDASSPNGCTSCFDGETTIHPSSPCVCCNASCKTCQGVANCTTCYEDSTLVGSKCVCKLSKVRDPITNKCEDACPIGYVAQDSVCVASSSNTTYAQLGSKFRNTIAGSPIIFENNCHNPQEISGKVPGHGSINHFVFNGKNTSIFMENFIPGDDFFIFMRFSRPGVEQGEEVGTLFSFAANAADPDEVFEGYEDTCKLADGFDLQKITFDLSLDSWMNLRASLDDKVLKFPSTPEIPPDSLEYIIARFYYQNKNVYVDITHSIDDTKLTAELISNKKFMLNSAQSVGFHIGSYLGISNFLKGNVQSFEITNYMHSYWRQDLKNGGCKYGEYYENAKCKKCHASWDSCFNGNPCTVCHSTCATCSTKDGAQHGSAFECESCFCGAAKDRQGRCQCRDGYTGTADNCQKKCEDGCEDCTSSGKGHCVKCKEHYELLGGFPGYCSACDSTNYDEEGFSLCRVTGGPFTSHSECDCSSSQWYDGTHCRNCAEGCLKCDTKNNGRCLKCADGLFSWEETDSCYDFVPYGYGDCGSNHNLCKKKTGSNIVFYTEFGGADDDTDQVWSYKDSSSHYTVTIFGGTQVDRGEIEEPFILADRGAWFDGKYDLMTFTSLIPVPTPSWRFWAKPHSDGTLYSNTSKNNTGFLSKEESEMKAQKRGYVIGIRAGRIQYADLSKGSVASKEDTVSYFEWQLISVHLKAADKKHSFQVFIQHNLDTVLEKTEIHKYYDHPEPKHSHLIGTSIDQEQYVDHFRGFLKTVSLYYSPSDLEISKKCSGNCQFCNNEELKWYGICNWNHYWDDHKCTRCPLWCKTGCEDGTC